MKSQDMDKIQCDASLYAPLSQTSAYVKKYKFTQHVKDSLKLPTFNNWEYEDNELVSLVMHMYNELGIPEHFQIDLQTLYNFVSKVRDNYNNNPFHCFKHGFCVFQMAFSLIHATGLVKDLTMLERLTLMTACLGHDLDHPGYNNAYQINGKKINRVA
jgi:high affinity cGMP-specific 3',5'-cyclic phosphodiesterase 9